MQQQSINRRIFTHPPHSFITEKKHAAEEEKIPPIAFITTSLYKKQILKSLQNIKKEIAKESTTRNHDVDLIRTHLWAS